MSFNHLLSDSKPLRNLRYIILLIVLCFPSVYVLLYWNGRPIPVPN